MAIGGACYIEERFFDCVRRRVRTGREHGKQKPTHSAQNDGANAGRKASGLPGKRRRERLSYISCAMPVDGAISRASTNSTAHSRAADCWQVAKHVRRARYIVPLRR